MDLGIYYRIMEHTHKLLKCNLTFQLVERNMYYLLFRLHSSAEFYLVKLIQNNAKKFVHVHFQKNCRHIITRTP